MKNWYNENQSKYYELWVSEYYDFEKDADSFEKVAKGKDILEIGIGTGIFADILIKRGFNVEGIEPSEFMISILKKNFQDIVYYKQDVISLNVDKQYDMVISHGTFPLISIRKGTPFFDCFLENDKENVKAFSNVRKHLKKRGLFLGSVQFDKLENVVFPDNYKNEIIFENNLSKKTHYFWNGEDWQIAQVIVSIAYTEDEFKEIMKKSGFRVISFSTNKEWWIAEAI